MTALLEINGKEFLEFGEILDEIGYLTNTELYIETFDPLFEEVRSGTPSFGSSVAKALSNTAETNRKVRRGFGDITDGGSDFITATFNITMSLVNLVARAIKFILTNLANFVTLINRTGQKIAQIPKHVLAKIRGDLELYITPEDVPKFKNDILPKIEQFMLLADEFSRGDMWGTMFNKDKDRDGIKNNDQNDMATARKMEKLFDYLAELQFDTTVVRMNNLQMINKIFSVDETKPNSEYFEGLKAISETMKKLKDPLTKLHDDVKDKVNRTKGGVDLQRNKRGKVVNNEQVKGQWVNLSSGAQERIRKTVQMLSKIVQIIGNFIRYVSKDMKTLENNTSRIMARVDDLHAKGQGFVDKEEADEAKEEEPFPEGKKLSRKERKKRLFKKPPDRKKEIRDLFNDSQE